MDPRAETIAAVATAPGRAGVAVVRVSGPDAFAVGERVAGRRPEPGRVLFARFAGDSGLLLAFRSPRSYTGEDVVELQCHGGAVAPRRVLEACFAAGARLARRGEFTERAFLNGKIAFEEAEGIIDLIDAKTDRAADAAIAEMEGGVAGGGPAAGVVRRVYSMALDLSSSVEHALDVSEEELPPGFSDSLAEAVASVRAAARSAMRTLRERRILRDGAVVVLAGPPNAGKSSLMNALLGESRAIVSAVPGTTRDSIEEWLDVGGWPVRLVDTAGLREADDEVEREGVRRSEALVAKADVVLLLEPCSGGALAERAGVGRARGRIVRVASKCDLARGAGLNVSSVTGEGLDDLRAAIADSLAALADSPEASAGEGLAERQMAALVEADAILAGAEAARGGRGFDLVLLANDVRRACEKLGALVGATYSDDLLDRLFSRFCVGK